MSRFASRWISLIPALVFVSLLWQPAARAQDGSGIVGIEVPAAPDCGNCLSSTTGQFTLRLKWPSEEIQLIGDNPPPTAKVKFVHLAGAPLEINVVTQYIFLGTGGVSEPVFTRYANGTTTYPVSTFKAAYPWAGKLAAGQWNALLQRVTNFNPWSAQVDVVVTWEVPTPPAPTPNYAYYTGEGSLTEPGKFQIESYGQNSNLTPSLVRARLYVKVDRTQVASFFSSSQTNMNVYGVLWTVPNAYKNGIKHTLDLHSGSTSTDVPEGRGQSSVFCLTPAGIPCDGTFITSGSVQGWGVRRGLRTQYPNLAGWLATYPAGIPMSVNNTVLSYFPLSTAVNTLIRSSTNSLFVLDQGLKRSVASDAAATALGYNPATATVYPEDVVGRIPNLYEVFPGVFLPLQ